MNYSMHFSQEGVIKGALTTEITFYINSCDHQIPGLTQAYETVLDLVVPHVDWYRTEKMARDRPVDEDALRALPYWFSSKASTRNEYGLRFGSGKTAAEVGAWGFAFYLVFVGPNEYKGYFHLNMPCTSATLDAKAIQDTVAQLSNVMAFQSGHAGFGIQLDEGEDNPQRDQWGYSICRRYSCVDARDLIGTLEIIPDRIKGVGWITLLNHNLLKVIGSIDYVRETLGSRFAVNETKHGIMLIAGKHPILGDVNASEDISLYRKINQLLDPIRTTWHPCIPGFTAETTQDWINRFNES